MKVWKKLKYIVLPALMVGLCGCEDFFNPDSDETLLDSEFIGSRTEFFSGYLGLASIVQQAGDNFFLPLELRGNCLEPTGSAPSEFVDLYKFDVKEGNKYVTAKNYYALILAANNFMKKGYEYWQANPKAISEEHFQQIISGTIRFKVWGYLQLLKIFGEAYYLDMTALKESDLENAKLLSYDDLATQMMALMEHGEELPNGKRINGMLDLNLSALLAPTGFVGVLNDKVVKWWNTITPHRYMLASEVSLFAADYQKAFDYAFQMLRIKRESLSGSADPNTFQSYYMEGSNWRMCNRNTGQTLFSSLDGGGGLQKGNTQEFISVIYYSSLYKQTNGIIDWTSTANKGWVKATPAFFDWQNEAPIHAGWNVNAGYIRNDRTNATYQKYLYGYSGDRANWLQAQIFMYRVKDIYYFLAEALNGLGRQEEALAILNTGPREPNVSGQRGTFYYMSVGVDVANFRYAFNNDDWNSIGAMSFRGIHGIHSTNRDHNADGKAYYLMPNWPSDQYVTTDIEKRNIMDTLFLKAPLYQYADKQMVTRKLKALDVMILEECAMEQHGEGRVLPMAIRMAKRHNDPTIVANIISKKYAPGETVAMRDKLQDPSLWFLKWRPEQFKK